MATWFATPTREPLGDIESCDRCGIRAFVRIVLANGGEIFLCREHARRHERALTLLRSRFHNLPM